MSDVLPKFKLFMFISVMSILLNLGYNIYLSALNDSVNILLLLSGFGTAFIPFINTISLAFTLTNVPVEVIAFIGIITTAISIVQTYLIAIMILNLLPLEDV
jgi:hypothetical protein